MTTEPDTGTTLALARLLRDEADRLETDPSARERLRRRIDEDAARPPRRPAARWRAPVVAVVGLALVAVVVLALGRGWRPDAVPAPAVSPVASTAGGTASTGVAPRPPALVESGLPTTLVYFPGSRERLVGEPRLRTTLRAAIAAIGDEPSNPDVSWPFGSMRLGSVVEQDGVVLVDYSGDDGVRPTEPDRAIATFWAQSLVHTVAAWEGRQVPVRVTLDGRPFRLFDRLDTTAALTFAPVEVASYAGIALPTMVPGPSPVTVVGAVAASADRITWAVLDEDGTPLASGSAPVRSDGTYAFTLAASPGRYALRIEPADAPAGSTAPGGFEVEG